MNSTLWLTVRMMRHEYRSHLGVFGVLVLASALFVALFGMMFSDAAAEGAAAAPAMFLTVSFGAAIGVLWGIWVVSVGLRSRQYATLRTLGFDRGRVLRVVSIEALILGVVAGVVGCLLAPASLWAMSSIFDAMAGPDDPTNIQWRPDWPVAISLAVASTASASLVATLRAGREAAGGVRAASGPVRRTRWGVTLLVARTLLGAAALGGACAFLLTGAQPESVVMLVMVGLLLLFVGGVLVLPGVHLPVVALVRRLTAGASGTVAPHVASAREVLKPQLSAAILMFTFVIFPAGLTTFTMTAQENSKLAMAQNMRDVTMLTSDAAGPIASDALTRLCASGVDCTHVVRERRDGPTEVNGVATPATWRFAMAEKPVFFEALPASGQQVGSNNLLFMSPWNNLVGVAATPTSGAGYVFVKDAPAALPAGVRAMPAKQWAGHMTPAVQYHGDGTGVAGILPFFSVLIIMGAAFVATSSFLQCLGYAKENARLRRLGLAGSSVVSAQVVQALLPWVTSMLLGALAVFPLGAYITEIMKGAGLMAATTVYPVGLVASSAALCAVALVVPVFLTQRLAPSGGAT